MLLYMNKEMLFADKSLLVLNERDAKFSSLSF